MRLSGLASGFDTEDMVRQLMQAERVRVDRFTQRRQINLWRQERFNEANKNIANFIVNSKRNLGLSKVSSTGFVSKGNYKNLDYLKKITSSNETVATAKPTGKVENVDFDIEVIKLASRDNTMTWEIDKNAKFSIKEGGEIKVGDVVVMSNEAAEGAEGIVEDKEVSINDIIKSINSNPDLKERNVSAIYDNRSGKILIQADHIDSEELGLDLSFDSVDSFLVNTSSKLKTELSEDGEKLISEEMDLTDKFKDYLKDGESFKLEEGTLVDDKILDELNSKLKPGLRADLSEDGQLRIIEDKDMTSGEITRKNGSFGQVKINGVLSYDDLSNNSIQFNGLNIDLKAEGTTNISIGTNTEGIIDKVSEFVSDYNSLLDDLAGALGEKRYPSFHPLSQEEKREMTDNDIKLWEEKAKSGMLSNDETVSRMLSKLRGDIYKKVEGLPEAFDSITKIGITTEKYSKGATGGKLQIDEKKLRAAIEENPDAVMDLLFKEEDETQETGRNSTNRGVFTGIYENLTDGLKSIINKSGPGEDTELLRNVRSNILIDFVTSGNMSEIDKNNSELDRQIVNMERILAAKEDSYYRQFTRMEKYMYEMNSQSSWLMQQFSM